MFHQRCDNDKLMHDGKRKTSDVGTLMYLS
jgi:hypothetical protein